MNDPHVESLEYRLVTGPTLSFQNPPPVAHDVEEFALVLEAGRLVVTMKAHCADETAARERVERFLRSWEIEQAVRQGRRRLRFEFLQSHIVDRRPDPVPEGPRIFRYTSSGGIALSGEARAMLVQSRYPAPPTHFVASPDVETLWNRYEGYVLEREPLPGMAYFCLTVVEARYGRGNRKAAARALNVQPEILSALGRLASTSGDEATARKVESGQQLRALTTQERSWIEAAILALIEQVGRCAAARGTPFGTVTMADLPPLSAP